MPLVSIFVIVVASMFAGWATPTESAAIGAFATMTLALVYRALTLANLLQALRGTVAVSGMILFIIVGATTFAQILSFSGASNGLVQLITDQGLAPMVVIAAMMLILIFLGIFVDQVSMMLITLPIFMPVVQALQIDLVWFGVMFLICMQLGLLLPPHGLLLMTMKGVAPPEVRMVHIFQGGDALRRDEHRGARARLLRAGGRGLAAEAAGELGSRMERSFTEEVKLLELGAGDTFHGEGILAVTKALLQSGVSYVGGYQGAPVSHMMDVLNDARDILDELGIHVETNASEAGAAAMLGASINYPMRGAVTWKSTVGTNVASDALVQSRLRRRPRRRADRHRRGLRRRRLDHPGAHARVRDEVADLAARPAPGPSDHREHGREGLRALRGIEHAGVPRAAHPRLPRARRVRGEGQPQGAGLERDLLERPDFDFGRICLPPSTYAQEKHKIDVRWPAAVKFIRASG